MILLEQTQAAETRTAQAAHRFNLAAERYDSAAGPIARRIAAIELRTARAELRTESEHLIELRHAATRIAATPLQRAIASGETRRPQSAALPGGRVRSGAGLLMIAREDAKHTPRALRTPAQDALIQIKTAYAVLLTERYNLRQAENAGAELETIAALRSMARAAEERYNELAAIAQPAIDSAV